MKWSQHQITFSSEDHPEGAAPAGSLPLVCTPTINNIEIPKTLMDGGAGLNVISVAAFDKMQVPYRHLQPTKPF